MHRDLLIGRLATYRGFNDAEQLMVAKTTEFIKQNPTCFERTLLAGHITGSAWVIDRSEKYVLLTHHQKLNKWLQLGGHSDGDPDTFNVALREAREESGLEAIKPVSTGIFDVDIHLIPERLREPAHFHYDIRFLFRADKDTPFVVSPESKSLAWVELERVAELTANESMNRMVAKTFAMLEQPREDRSCTT